MSTGVDVWIVWYKWERTVTRQTYLRTIAFGKRKYAAYVLLLDLLRLHVTSNNFNIIPLWASQILTHLPLDKMPGQWPPFRRWYFQMHFCEWKVCILIKNSLKFAPMVNYEVNRYIIHYWTNHKYTNCIIPCLELHLLFNSETQTSQTLSLLNVKLFILC